MPAKFTTSALKCRGTSRIEGLTNAYRWEDPEGAWNDGDPPGTGRTFTTKTLQLNFWRPGDEFDPHEDEIRFGIPGKEPYRWMYR